MKNTITIMIRTIHLFTNKNQNALWKRGKLKIRIKKKEKTRQKTSFNRK